LDISALDGEATHCLEISTTDYSVAWHHIPEEWNPQLHFYKNLQDLLIYSLIHLKRCVQKVWYEYAKATDHLENPGIDAILTKIFNRSGAGRHKTGQFSLKIVQMACSCENRDRTLRSEKCGSIS